MCLTSKIDNVFRRLLDIKAFKEPKVLWNVTPVVKR